VLEFFRDVNCKRFKTLLCEETKGVRWKPEITCFFLKRNGLDVVGIINEKMGMGKMGSVR